MNELQRARADWIEAQEKILKLEKQVSDLTQQNFALQMRLNVAECKAEIMKSLHDGMVKAVLTV